MAELKKCSRCGQYLPATKEYFYRDRRAKDGLQRWCRECMHSYNTEWQKEKGDRYGVEVDRRAISEVYTETRE